MLALFALWQEARREHGIGNMHSPFGISLGFNQTLGLHYKKNIYFLIKLHKSSWGDTGGRGRQGFL